MPKKKMTLPEWEDKRLEPDDFDDTEQEEDDFYEPDDDISVDEEGVKYHD